MIEVIEKGKTREAICAKCGSKLSFLENCDMQYKDDADLPTNSKKIGYIVCPVCNNEIQITTEYALEMEYTGFSNHDCETFHKCPKCGEKYGGWAMMRFEKLFRCQCGQLLRKPD